VSAPASVNADTRAALLECYELLRRAAIRARSARAPDPPAGSDTAGACRPLWAGARPTMHEATPSPTKSRRRFEEDDRSGLATSTDN
jgi:hypothetical protein